MSITVQGYQFEVPEGVLARYAEGATVTLTPGEASTFQQTFIENLRNNFAPKVKAAKNGSEELSPEAIADLQVKFNEYASTYQLGVRGTRGATGPRVKDPVEREMIKMAREDLAQAFFAKHGEKLKGEQLAEGAQKLLAAKHDEYARRARRAIQDREKAGMETLEASGLV